MDLLFTHLDRLDTQIIVKRLTDRSVSLSPDDIILEGQFNQTIIAALARGFPPPLSFKVEVSHGIEQLRRYCAFEWEPQQLLLCGVSLLPFTDMQQMIAFNNPWQYLRLLTTTEAGSVLRPLLAIKSRGLVAIQKNIAEFIMPLHRIDFLLSWLDRMVDYNIDLNWLSGSTGELDPELLKSVGTLNQERIPALNNWITKTSGSDDLDFEKIFSRAMIALPQ